jgi:hypothetical protein
MLTITGLGVLIALISTGFVIAAHNFLYALQRMREGWPAP